MCVPVIIHPYALSQAPISIGSMDWEWQTITLIVGAIGLLVCAGVALVDEQSRPQRSSYNYYHPPPTTRHATPRSKGDGESSDEDEVQYLASTPPLPLLSHLIRKRVLFKCNHQQIQ
jgi:hypothetical protein